MPPALHHDLIGRWAEAWTDDALDDLLAYEIGRVLGEAVLSEMSAGVARRVRLVLESVRLGFG